MYGVNYARRGIGGDRQAIKMNILYLANHLNIGGITSYVLALATGLKKRGHSIYIASSGGELLFRFIKEDIIYISIPIKTKQEISPKILISMFKLLGLIRQYDIDIVHSNSRTTQVLGTLLDRACGIAHISTAHGFFKKRFFRKLFPCWGRKVIAISESVRVHLRDDFGVKEQNIRIIHNGIDVERPKTKDQKPKMEIKIKFRLGDGPVVGIIARLSEEKAHNYLIEAMREVVDKIPQVQLLIVGEGRQKQRLVTLTTTLNLDKNIIFVPQVLDTKEVLSVMDIFVLPSLKEGLGLSLMEAMAAGCAVIGSNVGGIRSLIQDQYNGLLVEPTDSKALAKAILELLQDPEKRQYLGKLAQIFITQNFSQEKMVLETEKLYLECLG